MQFFDGEGRWIHLMVGDHRQGRIRLRWSITENIFTTDFTNCILKAINRFLLLLLVLALLLCVTISGDSIIDLIDCMDRKSIKPVV